MSVLDINNFNIIEDDENYYFFRALNMADNQDIENGTTLNEDSSIQRIRTDRERYEENPENNAPKYNKDTDISLEQVYDHIKMHYRKDTNCISLSSNANVSISYGRGFYKDRYAIIKVPKSEMGEKVINAGQYMLEEIEKKINEYINSNDIDNDLLDTLKIIDESSNSEEIKDIIKTRYTSKVLDPEIAKLRKGIAYRSPTARVSNYKSLNEEQSLLKNKIIGKLTLLERVGGMAPIIPNTTTNNLLVQTIGNAFASLEQIHYGEIPANSIMNISSEEMDIIALLQQVKEINPELVKDLEKELIHFIATDSKPRIPETISELNKYKVKDDITIDEMYELTEGRVEYGTANSIVKNMFYLSRAQANSKQFAIMLNEIIGNNPKYKDIVEYISKNGFSIEPEIITRQSNKGVKISESVSLDLKSNETELIDRIKGLSEEEQISIIQNGGLLNTNNIITDLFSKQQREGKITKEEYYAEAVFSLYDWTKIGIEEFTLSERNNLLQRLQSEHCYDLYKILEEKGIDRKDISKILLNIITRNNDFDIQEEDAKDTIKEKRLQQYNRIIENNFSDLNNELSIERIERFLGYYDVPKTGIKLRAYQQRAVEKANDIFENERFSSVILPTGAGKSFVTLAQLMQHKDEDILYLAPQNEILEQMKDYIIKYIHGPVNTLGRSKDDIIADVFPNIKFSTYPGLLAKNGKKLINKEYGYIVLDELHRTGADKWGEKLNDLIDNQGQNTKVLGITATPRRDSDGINMANEMAERLGYTNSEAVSGKHTAMNMSLTNAIRMGLVVNPKLVSCAYSLKTDGSLDRLKEKIEQIEDIKEKNEKIEKYEFLRRNLEDAEGISEILQSNVKKGGKYIVFLPIVDEIEDEDGNVIGRKTGRDKLIDYENQIREYLKDSSITPNFHSMLGEYGDKDNERRLEEFQNRNTEDTEFMLVMNKANEGLHLDKLDGMIWLRAMDEKSRILYLQQLGRVIYSENPDNLTKDEDRPVVIDLVNNTIKVNWENEITEQDDLQMLSIIIDWTEKHDGTLPDINSSDKEENGYASVLKEIQEKYQNYIESDFENLNEKQIDEIREILRLGNIIDLWQIDLPEKISREGEEHRKHFTNSDTSPFEIMGILKDFVELENEVESITRDTVQEFIEELKLLKQIGVDINLLLVTDTIKTLAVKSDISEDLLIQTGFDLNKKIGAKKSSIAQAYRGKRKETPPTSEQVQQLLELGIDLNERDTIQEFIEDLKILKGLGVDITKLSKKDTIKTLAQKSGISEEKLMTFDIDLNKRIGIKKQNLTRIYKGISPNGKKPTPEQVQELLDLGIRLDKEERDVVQEFIDDIKKLKELGVDITKIVQSDTIKTLAEKSGISENILMKTEIDLNKNIGTMKTNISRKYRGKLEGKKPTPKQIRELLNLGITLEERNTVQELIEELKQLKDIGVDVTRIIRTDTIKSLAEKSGIPEKEIIQIGLNPKVNIGAKKDTITRVYRGKANGYPPTQKQVQELLDLGITLDKIKKDPVQEFMVEIKKLKELGVNVTNITKNDTIKTLAEKSGIAISVFKNTGIDLNKKIGVRKSYISKLIRGKETSNNLTSKQRQELQELGVFFGRVKKDKTPIIEKTKKEKGRTVERFIKELRILKELGVDITQIIQRDTIKTLAEKSNIQEEEIEKKGLDLNRKIGSIKLSIARAYRGKGTNRPPTSEQVKELIELGISLDKIEKDRVQDFIEDLKKLKMLGVDVSKITNRDTIETLVKKYKIQEKEIVKIGFKIDGKIGIKKNNILNAYRGKSQGKKPTPEQARELLELGISLEKREITGKEIAEATIGSIKDIEMADREDSALKSLVEKTKEGGIKKDE